MGKAETFQDLSLAPPREGEELGRWLYTQLRAAILDGRLKSATRMPSTRNLSHQYGLARGTVAAAFDWLKSEGYLDTRVGSGTFIVERLPDEAMQPVSRTAHVPRPAAGPSHAALSARGRAIAADVPTLPASHSVGKAFRSYEPAIELFPSELWARVAGRVLRHAPRALYGQGDARGYLPLRKTIAEYVGAARSVRCDANRIIVTSGAQQGLDLVARLLLDPGDAVWMEDPGYPGAMLALRAAGASIVPSPVDRDGMVVEEAERLHPRAKLAYVTPANQFPLGVTLSHERRVALLDWAARNNAWIVEDEYDAEYRYSGSPLPALQSLDDTGCVIYVGTFTKMLFNSIRLGFLVVPERIADAFAAARTLLDRHPPTLEQAILTDFIMEGHFGHHVRRMRQVYAERGEALCQAAREFLSDHLNVVPAVAGMRTVAWLRDGQRDVEVVAAARAHGLEVAALSDFSIRHYHPNALVLGFAGCAPAELKRGAAVMAAAFEHVRR